MIAFRQSPAKFEWISIGLEHLKAESAHCEITFNGVSIRRTCQIDTSMESIVNLIRNESAENTHVHTKEMTSCCDDHSRVAPFGWGSIVLVCAVVDNMPQSAKCNQRAMHCFLDSRNIESSIYMAREG